VASCGGLPLAARLAGCQVQALARQDRSSSAPLAKKLSADAKFWDRAATAFTSRAAGNWASSEHTIVMQLYEQSISDLVRAKPGVHLLLSVLRLLPSGQAVPLAAVAAVWQALAAEEVDLNRGERLVWDLDLAGVVELSSVADFSPGVLGRM
jgi:hypothetical protein